mgnify:FL=1
MNLQSRIKNELGALSETIKQTPPILALTIAIAGYAVYNALANRQQPVIPTMPQSALEQSCNQSNPNYPFMGVSGGDEYSEGVHMNLTDKVRAIMQGDYTLPIETDIPVLREHKHTPEKKRGIKEPKSKRAFNLEAMKLALGMKETNHQINRKNKRTHASGSYQYLPSTALGLIKQARKEGHDIPYNGRMTQADISYALRTLPELNERLANYDLLKKARLFDGNPELIAAGHYMNQERLIDIIKTRYPGKNDFSDISIKELSRKKVHNGLLERKNNGEPTVLEYAECASNLYEEAIAGRLAKR